MDKGGSGVTKSDKGEFKVESELVVTVVVWVGGGLGAAQYYMDKNRHLWTNIPLKR